MRAAGALDELLTVAVHRLLGALAAHRAAQPLRLPGGEPGERAGDFDHLILEDDRAQRLTQRLLQRRVHVGDLDSRGLAQQRLRRSM